ncbi:hypothetical protein [Candidatus Albibeggiatoa sp. nov. NOAA]|uniref:hypothetical protein n=1 Tax=Candidatus Albibeggiatoa sp. nov. NOAA TaxID=3162724 RepID=UPI0032FBCCB3|nr:hypothetical protein [Thiotrichaceae bacterium]
MNDETKNDDAEKAAALYQYAKDVYDEELKRYNRIDDKAFKLLSVLSIFIGLFGFILRWLAEEIIPPESLYAWIVLISSSGLLIASCVSWWLMFRVIEVSDLQKMPLDRGVFDFFKNDLHDIHQGFAETFEEANQTNRKLNDKKAKTLSFGYKGIFTTAIFFVIFIIAVCLYYWFK